MQNLLALVFGQCRRLTANDLGDASSLRCGQLFSGGGAAQFANVKNVVVLAEPVGIRLDQRGASALQLLPCEAGCVA